MIYVCAWCIRDKQPSFLREEPPFENTNLSHGICAEHEKEWNAQVDEIHARRATEKVTA